MNSQISTVKKQYNHKVYFLTGVFTALMVCSIIGAGVVYQVGWQRWKRALGLTTVKNHRDVPDDVVKELNEKHAVIENIDVLNQPEEHNTILVQPDQELEYKLRPNVSLDVMTFNVVSSLELDTPLLHLPTNVGLSEKTRQYIQDKTGIRFRYTTDSLGRRINVPSVSSAKKVLVVGDSVAFGVGVDDKDTVVSQLQSTFGADIEVVNAAVGGYGATQALKVAESASQREKYLAVVYVACQNDFMEDDQDWSQNANTHLRQLKKVADRFDNRVLVILVTSLEYNANSVLGSTGWDAKSIEQTTQLRSSIKDSSASLGFRFADWTDLVNDYRLTTRTEFAPFSLYVDHLHLSPAGNRILSERIANEFRTARWLTTIPESN